MLGLYVKTRLETCTMTPSKGHAGTEFWMFSISQQILYFQFTSSERQPDAETSLVQEHLFFSHVFSALLEVL